ncbi:hypothetical protein KKE13_01170 [Patescibacteria group bacterium]|nr:hypothetical protein [Patescibacteria group bacterium]
MLQIFATLGFETSALFTDGQVWALGKKLIPLVETYFNISAKNDGSFTAIRALTTEKEAAVQIEVRYLAGRDKYEWGRPFDPTEKEQRAVAKSIERASLAFFKEKGLPKYSLSIWINPSYKGIFMKS